MYHLQVAHSPWDCSNNQQRYTTHQVQATTLRAFLALDFDAEGQAHLTTHLRRLRAAPWADQVRWVHPEHLHLTLRFLGEVTPIQVNEYMDSFRSRLGALGTLRLRASGPRLFPTPSRPRLVACLIEAHPALDALAALAESCAVGIGLPAESRPFQGHVTLGRTRDQRAGRSISLDASPSTALTCSEITLYRSQLQPHGQLY